MKNTDDKRNEKLAEQADGAAIEEAAEKLGKSDVDEVAGGAGAKNRDVPPELPEIP